MNKRQLQIALDKCVREISEASKTRKHTSLETDPKGWEELKKVLNYKEPPHE